MLCFAYQKIKLKKKEAVHAFYRINLQKIN